MTLKEELIELRKNAEETKNTAVLLQEKEDNEVSLMYIFLFVEIPFTID